MRSRKGVGVPTDVTRLLQAARDGDVRAAEQLLPIVYEDLRRLARQRMAKERNGHTLQATALVHEAYLRLLNKQEVEWSSAGHFFGAAAEAMRRILIERARQRQSQKRGGDCERIELSVDLLPEAQDERLMQLDEALDALRAYDVRKEQVVKLRYFAGLTNPEVAAVLDISTATVERDWLFARAWLKHRIG